jgi:T3SS (YopN, CesT) and YbjN peptide-binding chaperone 1
MREKDSLTVQELRAKVQRDLIDMFGAVDVDDEGDFSLPHGSTRVFVSVVEWSPQTYVLRVFAITNSDVTISPELTLALVTANSEVLFGKFSLLREKRIVLFEHALLAQFVAPEELKVAVAAVAVAANDYDEKIQQIAGGKLFVDG